MIETKVYTRDEYLALEESEKKRYEFFNGEIFEIEMGASERHQIICTNLSGELRLLLRDVNCRVLASGMRVQTRDGLDTYPDILVVCGDSQYVEPKTDTGRDTLTNPIAIIEVLSKSTRGYDRTHKFQSYRTIPTLQEFVTVEQDRVFVEHFRKLNNGEWLLREYATLDASVPLDCLGISLSIKSIYEKTGVER